MFQHVLQLLPLPQIVEAESVVDDFVREIHVLALGAFDNAIAFIVVVRDEPRIRYTPLLRQVNEFDEFSSWHIFMS